MEFWASRTLERLVEIDLVRIIAAMSGYDVRYFACRLWFKGLVIALSHKSALTQIQLFFLFAYWRSQKRLAQYRQACVM